MTDPVAGSGNPPRGTPPPDTPPPDGGLSEEDVDRTRAWTGLCVVVGGDIAIAVAVIFALSKFVGSTGGSNSAVLASIMTSAFAAISTMTTAYFGIRASSNTAQRSIKHHAATAVNRTGDG